MEFSKARPVLEATYRLLDDDDEGSVRQDAVCAVLDRPADETIRALALLYEGGYIRGFMAQQSPAPIVIQATEKGLQEVRGWPRPGGLLGTEYVELLLRLLDERIEHVDTPEEDRGKLRRVKDALVSAGPRVIGDTLAALISKIPPPIG